MVESTIKLTQDEIKKLTGGKFDEFGFYVFEDESFYDPEGYFFNQWGFDDQGGRYNENSDYVERPIRVGKDEFSNQLALTHTQIKTLKGAYDQDGFYRLESGAFYDPYGYYFDEDGYDEAGGKYDDLGYYHTAEEVDKLENFDEEDEDDLEDTPNDDASLEEQAIYEEHVLMACNWVKQQLQQNPELPLIVRIVGISPDSFSTEEQVIKKVLEKKVPGLKFDQIFSVRKKKQTIWYVASCDKATVIGLLKMHMQRCQLTRLQTWVFDYEGYLDSADDELELALISESKSIREQMNLSKGKPVYQKAQKAQNVDVTKAGNQTISLAEIQQKPQLQSKPQEVETIVDGEFEIKRKKK